MFIKSKHKSKKIYAYKNIFNKNILIDINSIHILLKKDLLLKLYLNL